MSPELFYPKKFSLKDARQTKCSDCYALGMVIYEVLSGQVPFSRHHGYAIIAKVLEGERPGRPQGRKGTWFVGDIWGILKRCWKPNPRDRPSIKDVLQCLEKVSRSWTPPSAQVLAIPLTSNPLVWNSDPSAEESLDEDEASSPSEAVSSQPSQKLSLKGNPGGNNVYLLTHESSALPYDALDYQDSGTSAVNPKRSGLRGSPGIPDRVS